MCGRQQGYVGWLCAASVVSVVRTVVCLFAAVGNAPILKQKKFKIRASDEFYKVSQFLRKQLAKALSPGDAVVCLCLCLSCLRIAYRAG